MLIAALLVNAKNIRCHDSTSSSKKRVLENLSHMLASNTESITADDVFQALLERERLGSTGLGKGVAIPHTRIPGITQTIAAMMTLESPIDYDAPDNKPVDIIFALLAPKDDSEYHLKNLARLVTFLRDDKLCQSIRNITDPDEMFDLLLAIDDD